MKPYFEFAQKSDDWYQIRRGIPTASEFKRIIQPKEGKASASQGPYIDQLIAEIVDQRYSQEPSDSYVSPSMQVGINLEQEARDWYSLEYAIDVKEVGFCMSDCGRYGSSPDGLIYLDGVLVKALEIKVPDLKTHLGYLREGVLPSEYRCQCHGHLAVCEIDEMDFLSLSQNPAIENFVVTVKRDEFTEKLRDEVVRFCDRLDETKRRLNLA